MSQNRGLLIGAVVGVAMLGVSAMVCAGVGMLFWVKSEAEPVMLSQATAPEDVIAAPAGVASPQWVDDTMDVNEFRGMPKMSRATLESLKPMEVLEVMAFDAFGDGVYLESLEDTRRHMVWHAPQKHPQAGQEVAIHARKYVSVGGISYIVSGSLFEGLAQGPPPAACAASWAPGEWSFFSSSCKQFTYDELAKLYLGKPLYKGLARLDVEAVKQLSGFLLDLDPMQRVMGGGATVGEVYVAFSPAAKDFLTTHAALKKYGEKKALERYRQALKVRGAGEPKGAQRDMVDFYYTFSEELSLQQMDYGHTLVGFWLRRMDDGSAPVILEFIKGAEARYGSSKHALIPME